MEDKEPAPETQPDEDWAPDPEPLSDKEKAAKYEQHKKSLEQDLVRVGYARWEDGKLVITDREGAFRYLQMEDLAITEDEARYWDEYDQKTKDSKTEYSKALSDLINSLGDEDEDGDTGSGGSDPQDPDDSTPFGDVDDSPEDTPSETEEPLADTTPAVEPSEGVSPEWTAPSGHGDVQPFNVEQFRSSNTEQNHQAVSQFVKEFVEYGKSLPAGTRVQFHSKSGMVISSKTLYSNPNTGFDEALYAPSDTKNPIETVFGISLLNPTGVLDTHGISTKPPVNVFSPEMSEALARFRSSKHLLTRTYAIQDLPEGTLVTLTRHGNKEIYMKSSSHSESTLINVSDPSKTLSSSLTLRDQAGLTGVTVKKPTNQKQIDDIKKSYFLSGQTSQGFGQRSKELGAVYSLGSKVYKNDNGSWVDDQGNTLTDSQFVDNIYSKPALIDVSPETKEGTVLGSNSREVFSLSRQNGPDASVKRVKDGFLLAHGTIFGTASVVPEGVLVGRIFENEKSQRSHRPISRTETKSVSDESYNTYKDSDLNPEQIKDTFNELFGKYLVEDGEGFTTELLKLPVGTKIIGETGTLVVSDTGYIQKLTPNGEPIGRARDVRENPKNTMRYFIGSTVESIEIPSKRFDITGEIFQGQDKSMTNEYLDKLINAPRSFYNFDNMSFDDISNFFHEKFGEDFIMTHGEETDKVGAIGKNRKILSRLAELMEKYPWTRNTRQITIDDKSSGSSGAFVAGLSSGADSLGVHFSVNSFRTTDGRNNPNSSWNDIDEADSDALRMLRRKGYKTGFFMNITDREQYAADHEFGHLMDGHRHGAKTKDSLVEWLGEYLGETYDPERNPLSSMIEKVIDKGGNDSLSVYGWFKDYVGRNHYEDTSWVDSYETFAESFADVEQNGSNANDVSKFLYKKMVADSQRRSAYLVKYGKYPSSDEDYALLEREFPMPDISV